MQCLDNIIKKINQLETTFEKYNDIQIKIKTKALKKKLQTGEKKEQVLPEAFALVREATKRITGKRLYDVQLKGGYILTQGKIAEIKAGEGKTLIQTLPAYLNALEGKGVHVITTNEYLARRDYEEVKKILELLGVSVGLIYQNMDFEERKKAYKQDVTYGTNTEFGFDYLRDNIVKDKKNVVQRELKYGIIDEVDSILIDEAQTPMIISTQKIKLNPQLYIKANQFVKKLKGITILKENHKSKKQLKQNEKYDYVVDETYKTVELTQNGIRKAEDEYKLNNFYDSKNIDVIASVKKALIAHNILKKDREYIVQDDKILIIDKLTGRIMSGKRYVRRIT